MSAERLHHPFSPSKLQVLEACPLFTGEESSRNEASEAGTRQHDAAEEGIDIDDPRLADHEADAVALCKEYRDKIVAKYPGGTVIKEEYLNIDDVVLVDSQGNKFKGTTGGYLDVGVINAEKTIAEICDWKFGQWSVEPTENNLQGIAYLLGLYYRFPSLQQVTVHFVMPHRGEGDFHTFQRSQFDGLLLRVKTVVARAKLAQETGDFSKAQVTVSACLFCGNKGKCPALAAFAIKLGKKYAPAQIPETVTPSLLRDAKQAKLSMEIAQLMEAWGKATRGQITARAIEEDEWMPEGYVLRSRTDNEIKNFAGYIRAARKAGVPASAIRAALAIRMTPINKAIQDASPRGSKKAAADAFRADCLEKGILEESQGAIFLERLKS